MTNSSKKPLRSKILILKVNEKYHLVLPLVENPSSNPKDWRSYGREYDSRAIAFFYYNEQNNSARTIYFANKETEDEIISLAKDRHNIQKSKNQGELETLAQIG